ncbi:GLSK Glutaminase, partial [Polypterus senegalus]
MLVLKRVRASSPGFVKTILSAAVKWTRPTYPRLLKRTHFSRQLHTYSVLFRQSSQDVNHTDAHHVLHKLGGLKPGMLPGLEDLLFYTITEGKEQIPITRFINVADYIPQLAKFSPDLWGVSLCTVDGQRHSVGDTRIPFCLQSCVKPLEYAIAINEVGTERVHRYVGKEPSGLRFNKLFLNDEDRPHNPMVNAGAIVISSLIKPSANKAEKFDYVMDFLNKMAGSEYVGFSNATFQSEKETGDRNFAIGYYLKEKKLCSIEVTCESSSVMAATLANGGICPITGERVLSAEAVRNTLSLMHSCGMYDFSGQFAFHELVSLFNFHNYDNLRHFAKKLDPRREPGDIRVSIKKIFSVYNVMDNCTLKMFALSAMDMEQKDYDSRTALHVAASEGHMEVVRFLVDGCKVNPFTKDRWGNSPLDDAVQFGHQEVADYLKDYQTRYAMLDPGSEVEDLSKLETLESMV